MLTRNFITASNIILEVSKSRKKSLHVLKSPWLCFNACFFLFIAHIQSSLLKYLLCFTPSKKIARKMHIITYDMMTWHSTSYLFAVYVQYMNVFLYNQSWSKINLLRIVLKSLYTQVLISNIYSYTLYIYMLISLSCATIIFCRVYSDCFIIIYDTNIMSVWIILIKCYRNERPLIGRPFN